MLYQSRMKPAKTLLALLAFSALLGAGCQTTRTTAGEWEYKVVEKPFPPGQLHSQINELAADGWELVSVSTTKEAGSVHYGFIVVRKPK